LRAAREHLERGAPLIFEENINPFQGELAAALVRAAGPSFETCFFTNSGTEAVEAAIKTAMAATRRPRVAYAEGAFHGTTLGSLACMGCRHFRDDFEPALPDYPRVPFGDLGALERALSAGDVAAFLVEPVQIEAGVRIASDDYLRGAKELCARHGALLILDEVQTGMGRTGRLFAFQRSGVAPDILCLAKSLGGGVVPIGAAVMGEGVWRRAFGTYLRSEIHTSTFGGNSLSCAVARKALEMFEAPGFLEGVRARGERLFGRLAAATDGCEAVRTIRWLGLIGGIQLRDADHPWFRWENMGLPDMEGYPTAGVLMVERLGRRGMLTLFCSDDWTVLRIEPPLTVSEEAIDRFAAAVGETVRWLSEGVAA
jgi:putrescine aminotransferase